MKKLLLIESSPRKERSHSSKAAATLLQALQAKDNSLQVDKINLFEADLPPFDGYTISAKYAVMHGQPHDEKQAKAWQAVKDLAERFSAADIYIISIPMWNFSIPYRLKHYIDLLVQPGLTFSVDEAGQYNGLLKNKKAYLVYASGGVYTEEAGTAAYDQQKGYMRQILGFIGITDIQEIIAAPTLAGPEAAEKADKDAAQQIGTIA